MSEELVVLVNDRNEPVGTTPKATVHTDQTPLHRGFSVFLFNPRGELLLQQRAFSKRTWPGVWSNSCCGHPAPDETVEAAAQRRLRDELGLDHVMVEVVLPEYRYRAELDGIVEHEICPVLVAATNQPLRLNPDEVADVRWVPWTDFVDEVRRHPTSYSPWCVEETLLLADHPAVARLVGRSAGP